MSNISNLMRAIGTPSSHNNLVQSGTLHINALDDGHGSTEVYSHSSNTLHGNASQLILGNDGVSQPSDTPGGSSQDADHDSDKLHPDIRPYAMMTRTGYMEFDPMKVSDDHQLARSTLYGLYFLDIIFVM
ncbi:hypothetical protein L195_g026581 [Trifolium pratense]|uniref:Uncharacterized protein n=1 Tax=Trifolium pratense TaxID=57577 RepID=A0A2K3NJN1_TRIPR|nr:hypothetical protein L195_g026581 [Trifolium pratense]